MCVCALSRQRIEHVYSRGAFARVHAASCQVEPLCLWATEIEPMRISCRLAQCKKNFGVESSLTAELRMTETSAQCTQLLCNLSVRLCLLPRRLESCCCWPCGVCESSGSLLFCRMRSDEKERVCLYDDLCGLMSMDSGFHARYIRSMPASLGSSPLLW